MMMTQSSLNYGLRRQRIFLAILLISLPSLLWAQAGDQAAPVQSGLTFGSPILLAGCWSAAELTGSPAEKKGRDQPPCQLQPPPALIRANSDAAAIPPNLRNSIRAIALSDEHKLIALTFDLCEGQGEIAGYDGDLVDYLRKNQIKATFYAGGKWLQSHPERAMQLMADPLFEIGNHSWNHPNFRLLTEPHMQKQILWTQAQYKLLWDKLAARVQAKNLPVSEMDKIPLTPLTFRFPYGVCSPQALQVAAGLGLPAIHWSLVTADPVESQSAARIAEIIQRGARPGVIVIMHANGRGIHTAAALPLCVPQLQDRGYQFVTVSELLQAGPPISKAACFSLNPPAGVSSDVLIH